MLDVMTWAAERFQHCLLAPRSGSSARLLGRAEAEPGTIRTFAWDSLPIRGIGWCMKPPTRRCRRHAGNGRLIAKRNEGKGYYDRFRDRVIFPIRDVQGRIVGFGGRILPSSPVSADRPPPKYYNSAETALFSKSEQLYGIDQGETSSGEVRVFSDRRRIYRRPHGPPARHRPGGRDHGDGSQRPNIKQLKRVVSRVVLVF